MLACPKCGHENRDGAKFCEECALPLGAPAPLATEERKVVTSLFCDLVGFTATSESADPEDVDRMLGSYFAMARGRIEAHGGVVEKFIGDAVVGVFGVPAAHEDDPERAVRAGLQIAEFAGELKAVGGKPLRLRVGVNTGEALIHLAIQPGSGVGFLAGDTINTASRIQSVAPEMGVAVGISTYELTASSFDYEELEPATLKGKSEPVRIFHPKTFRPRVGVDLTPTHDTPFVGREAELARLERLFARTVDSQEGGFVTIVGEPGIGKSRIVAEFRDHVGRGSERITWRQGRCLPYGEGITFWALGEILKAHAGILDSDGSDVARAKLDAVLPEGDERAWFRQRLLPLLGIEATSSAEREELFTAWRRFLGYVAEQGPTVLVFEDLHWADESMLAFLEHLAGRAEGASLFVIGTARPELFERHPDYATGLRNTTPISLAPLSQEETARLVADLLERTVIPADLQQPILDRAEGNPLYAGELVRFLKERDALVKTGSSWELRDEVVEAGFPDSIHALIAARLDLLEPKTKSTLADAAVVGKVFWAGALAQMGGRDLSEVRETLRELSRKELVRPALRSSIEGDAEYAFWHILSRDVAYAQLPRSSRATRHVAAAAWIESKAPERIEDLADVLAHHYSTALELARASGRTQQANELEGPALRFLTLAGERALGLDTAAALTSFERALALTPSQHLGRPKALARFGEAAFQAGRLADAAEALNEALASFREAGDLAATTRAMAALGDVLFALSDPRAWTLPEEALKLLEPLPPGPELVGALTEVARERILRGKEQAGLPYAERALALADDLGLDRSARTLGYRGMARGGLGDPGGVEDMREAIVLATHAGQGFEAGVLYNNLGLVLWGFEGPAAALEVLREGIAFAKARGLLDLVEAITKTALDMMVEVGALDEALEVASDLAEHVKEENSLALGGVRAVQARILALRGQAAEVADSLQWLESASRGTELVDQVVTVLGSTGLAYAGLEQEDQAAALFAEIESTPDTRENHYYAALLPTMLRAALAIGEPELAERLVGGFKPRLPLFEHALVAANAALTEARGDLQAASKAYAEAADRFERFGVVPEQGFALLGQSRCLVRLGRSTDASAVLQDAREIFERLRAAPALKEIDLLLKETIRPSF